MQKKQQSLEKISIFEESKPLSDQSSNICPLVQKDGVQESQNYPKAPKIQAKSPSDIFEIKEYKVQEEYIIIQKYYFENQIKVEEKGLLKKI